MFAVVFLLSTAWSTPWDSSGERFYLADPQFVEGRRLQMIFSFTRDAKILLGMFMDRKPAMMMEGPCRSLSTTNFECDFVSPKTGEVVATKGFTYDSSTQSIVYDGRTKACRIQSAAAKQLTDGGDIQGCSEASSSGSNSPPSSGDAELREIARKEYPNDAEMQQYVYERQVEGKKYMQSVNDAEAKAIAYREYPSDYTMQKYVYDKQTVAKKYMSSVVDMELKKIALREYPSDYTMQKYVYDKQAVAKKYMQSVPESSRKLQAVQEYPSDYTMQKYVYDKGL